MKITASEILQPIVDMLALLVHWVDTHISTVLYVGLVLIVASLLSRVGGHIFSKILHRTVREDMFPTKTDRDRRLRTLSSISTAIINFLVWAVASIMILNRLGVNTAPLLASAGILSVAFGFGAQSLVRDFVTGIFIIAENQYRVGDYVEIQNITGTVKSVTMRTTVVQDDDGSVFHIPNGSIVVTGNHTMNNNKVSLELSASTETDIDKLKTIINKVGKQQQDKDTDQKLIIEPMQFKRIKDIKAASVIIRISGKVRAGKQIEVKSAYYSALQKELVKNKIALK